MGIFQILLKDKGPRHPQNRVEAFTRILMKLELPKIFIRFGVNFFAEHMMKDAIKLKKEHGFNNDEMKIIYEVMTDVIQQNEKAWTCAGMPAYNKDRRLWTNMRDITCTIADSDTYYLLRVFYILSGLFERQSEFKIQKWKDSPWWGYEEMERAKEWKKQWEEQIKKLQMQEFEKIIDSDENGQTKL